MAKHTSRDKVWIYAMNRCIRKGKTATPALIAEMADVSERMARDCLLSMAQAEWLLRKTNPDGTVEYMCMPGVEAPETAG